MSRVECSHKASSRVTQELRIQPEQCTGEWNGFTHVLQTADPRHGPLNPHAEPSVRHAAVLAQIEIPPERLFRQTVLVDALHQQLIGRSTLRAANDFAVTF